jgi:hypothetical protein
MAHFLVKIFRLKIETKSCDETRESGIVASARLPLQGEEQDGGILCSPAQMVNHLLR